MKKFLRKKPKGEITVFLTLVLLSFLGFFAVLTEGIRVRTAKTAGERALNLALSSTFTEYYRPLWEEYHLFGLSREGLEERIKEYMALDYGLSLDELSVEEVVWGTEYDGKIFLHQAEAYEKYKMTEPAVEKGFAKEFSEAADKAEEKACGDFSGELPEDMEEVEEGRTERRKMGKLKALWGRNSMEMVLERPAELSKKKLIYGPAAGVGRYSISSTSPGKNLRQVKEFLREQAAEAAELRYYQEHFKSYVKNSMEFQKKESALDYELEYLLEGRGSDRDNMEAWLRRLVLTRTSLNYLVISEDNAKSQAAYGMALSALGFTGMEALVRAGQQFILLGWSYEEALVDARVLLNGGSVSLWKKQGEFSISFREVFGFSKQLVKQKAEGRMFAKQPAGALNYEDYLSLFLGFKKEEKRREAAWYLIDENMSLRYGEDFLLKDTVFGVHVKAEFFLPGHLGKDWHLEAERHYAY